MYIYDISISYKNRKIIFLLFFNLILNKFFQNIWKKFLLYKFNFIK